MRSRLGAVFIAPLILVLLAGCAATPAPTPAPQAPPPAPLPTILEPAIPTVPPPTVAAPPTSAPTVAPPTASPESRAGGKDDLARAEASGVLRVATSLDNPPFSTYDNQRQPGGFDIALITELARRLGFGVDIQDFEFENLMDALAANEADAAIAAISITPERAAEVSFTNAYYVGQDAVLAAPSSSVRAVGSLDDLAKLRVGVQRGTLYESWLRTNGVDAGKMPAENLVTYPSPDEGVLDLTAGNIDVFMLDRPPALTFVGQGRARLVGERLYPQVYGIGVRKDSNLLPELNRVLAEVQADGTLAELVRSYLSVPATGVLPATRQAIPTVAATP